MKHKQNNKLANGPIKLSEVNQKRYLNVTGFKAEKIAVGYQICFDDELQNLYTIYNSGAS